MFAPAVSSQESNEQLRKHWLYWKTYYPHLLNSLPIQRFVQLVDITLGSFLLHRAEY